MQERTARSLVTAALSIAMLPLGCERRAIPPPESSQASPSTSGETEPAPAVSRTVDAPLGPASAPVPPVPDGASVFSFDSDPAGGIPRGFSFGRTGEGNQGRWIIQKEADAPTAPNILGQLDANATDFRFPVAVADAPSLSNVRLSVKCKMISGKLDRACGLVARYRDENNYFLTRANALENNVRLYTVQGGKRRQLESWSGTVTPNAWHDYRLEIRGDHLEVFWDGRKVIEHHDATFSGTGRIGVWTKADSVTYFDDLSGEAL